MGNAEKFFYHFLSLTMKSIKFSVVIGWKLFFMMITEKCFGENLKQAI